MNDPRTVVLAANRGYALTSSRTGLIQRFLEEGWRVVVATADDEESRSLAVLGATLEPVAFNRGGLAVGGDIGAYRRLSGIYRRHRPALVHHFHAKPVILGSIAARRALGESVSIVNSMTGLGQSFVAGGLTAWLAGIGYRRALRQSNATVFQNRDDHRLFLDRGWVSPTNSRLIVGSGIDVQRFSPADWSHDGDRAPTVVMLARLLRQKGVAEFAEVAKRIRARWPAARFVWAGEEDDGHPDSVSARWMEAQPDIDYVGCLSDVTPLLKEAHVVLFPSFYREGVPRVIMEAAATGVPTVAFDVPGVREAVRDGETGYLVPDRDVDALAGRVEELLSDGARRLEMGKAARALAVAAFDRAAIQEQHLSLYRELGIEL